jgi:aminoglycoside/choline kinase family phosphotransferase
MERFPLAPDTINLSPAQIKFLKNTIPAFTARGWTMLSAGRAGSDRRFVRVKAKRTGESYILVIWDGKDPDWKRFISIQRDISSHMEILPAMYAYDEDLGCIVEEDLGAVTLKKYCAPPVPKGRLERVYRNVLDSLAQWQRLNPGVSAAIGSRDMDMKMFLWESGYFSEHCVTEYFGGGNLLSEGWEKERLRMAQEAASFPRVCIHRDFQSENIMLRGRMVRLVDFQGARCGPAAYDVASLLYDPYVAALTPALALRLFAYYRSIAPLDVPRRSLRICAMQRLMQALGAYANLSIHKGKQWYQAFVPIALKRLAGVAGEDEEFPVLKQVVSACCGKI